MGIITIPKPLREKLGDDGTEGFIEVLNRQEENTTNSVTETAADRFERRLTEGGTGLDTRIPEVEARLDNRITEVDAGLRVEIHKSKTDTIKWMFIFYIGHVAALGGILFAVLR